MTQSDGHFETRDDEQLVSDQIAGEAALTAPGPRRDVSADIAAEIDDHLAEASAAAQTRGLSQQQARQSAHSRFGDVATIARRCWWINRGEIVMFRSAAIVLMSICVLGLFLVAYSAWRIEASFSDQMGALSTQLAALNQTQQKMLENADRPGEPAAAEPDRAQITGKLYLGDPSIPAANADVEVWNAKTTERVRQMRTDSNGEFATGQLPDGEYFVLASLVGEGNPRIYPSVGAEGSEWRKKFCVQSEVYSIWPDGRAPRCDLDVQFEVGEVSLELNRDVNHVLGPVEDANIPLRIGLLHSPTVYNLPTFQIEDAMMEWPAYAAAGSGSFDFVPADHTESLTVLAANYNAREGMPVGSHFIMAGHDAGRAIPKGAYLLRAAIGPDLAGIAGGGFAQTALQRALDRIRTALQRSHSTWNRPQLYRGSDPFSFEVRPNQRTRLRIVVPEGYEETLTAALAAEELDEEELLRLCAVMPLEIELIGYEPLDAQ